MKGEAARRGATRLPTRVPRAMQIRPGASRGSRPAPPPAPLILPSARTVATFLVLMIVVSGILYPGTIRLVADLVAPGSSDGSTISLGENVTDPALFWLRPSLIDWQALSGAGSEVPYGPLNPQLANQTELYIQQYGLANVSVPLSLVTPSESGLDPDLYPAAVLVQIPRVAHFSNLTQADLTTLVDRFILRPTLGLFGPSYVDVIQLDKALLGVEGRAHATVVGG